MKAIIVGGGINGVTTAIELRQRGHEVALIDPGPLPHPLAASTDISKAVRAAYGEDEFYSELAQRAIPLWRKWNQEFGIRIVSPDRSPFHPANGNAAGRFRG